MYEAWIREIPNRQSKVLEKVNLEFVCAAQKISSRLLQDSDLRSLVFELEESWGKASPFFPAWDFGKSRAESHADRLDPSHREVHA